MKKILKNLLVACGIVTYFMILIFAHTKINIDRLTNDIKVFASTFLVVGLYTLEKAYKKDNGNIAIIGIELIVLSFHSVSIMHMINVFKCDYNFYLTASSVIFTIYYILKGIVIYTKDRKEYLKGLSDISEIVKENEPVKKEAKKRNNKAEKIKVEENKEKEKKVEIKKEEKYQKKNTSDKKMTQKKKATSTKNNSTTTKKEKETKKTTQTEEKNKAKAKTKRNITKKINDNDESQKNDKTEKIKKNTSTKKKAIEATSEISESKKAKADTTKKRKSEKEVK